MYLYRGLLYIAISFENYSTKSPLPPHMMRPILFAIIFTSYLFLAMEVQAQTIEADPKDVHSIEAIIAASYEVISGEAGEQRDWDRERSLFYPGARHMPIRIDSTGRGIADIMDAEGFIERVTPYFEANSFYEYEIAQTVDQFGHIAHVFSTYAWSNEKGGPVGGRGINSFQLMFDGERWWILSIMWQQESEAHKIPSTYLN